MKDSPFYENELKNELNLKDIKKIVDNFQNTCKELNATPRINFTGGDPLIRKDFFEILQYCKDKGVTTGILGNSYLLNEKTVKKLKELQVEGYQISLDGLEKTHDYFRKKGSFKDALRAFELLKKYRIRTTCMFTLSKKNKEELIPLMNFMADKVNLFAFSRIVCEGNAKELEEEDIPKEEYRKFLLKILEEYRKLEKKTKTFYNFKDHLWTPLLEELGLFFQYGKESNIIYEGCSLGIRHMTILSDGTVLACRRLPTDIGKVPEQKLLDIFLKSKKLNDLRSYSKMEKCGECELLQYCRGCPAVAAGKNGSYFSPDPQCWK